MSQAIRENDRTAMQSALSQFESCEKRLPDHALLVSSVGVVNYYLKNWSTAKRQFERAVRLQSDLFEPRYFLADIAFREGDAKTAVTHGSAAQKLWPHHPGPYYILGRAYDKSGDVKSAIPNYEGVLALSNPETEEYKYAAKRLAELKGE
jgi:tetratricopeptide (TPR) repeat protein